MLAAFYLWFGEIDGYAVAFTAFLLILAAGFDQIPRFRARALAEGLDPAPPYARREGCVGAIWMLSFPFAPFVSWALIQLVGINQSNWRWLLALIVTLCIIVPAISVLPLLRYLRRGFVAFQLTVLALGTGFPIVTALGSAHDLIAGPVWQVATVEQIGTAKSMRGHGAVEDLNEIVLADGRKLVRASEVELRPGRAQLLVLTGTRRIIAARGQ